MFLCRPAFPFTAASCQYGGTGHRARRAEREANASRCEKCGTELHDAEFQLQDLGRQLKPIIESFYKAEELRTCKKCGHVMALPGSAPAPK
jgi:predicted nucleic-acid-binding Zn-ribbon protein